MDTPIGNDSQKETRNQRNKLVIRLIHPGSRLKLQEVSFEINQQMRCFVFVRSSRAKTLVDKTFEIEMYCDALVIGMKYNLCDACARSVHLSHKWYNTPHSAGCFVADENTLNCPVERMNFKLGPIWKEE